MELVCQRVVCVFRGWILLYVPLVILGLLADSVYKGLKRLTPESYDPIFKEEIKQEFYPIMFTTIFTAWLSPCSVWENNKYGRKVFSSFWTVLDSTLIKYSGDLKSGLLYILTSQKDVGLRMVWILNGI